MKRKKYRPEYRRQLRNLHIVIDAETLQMRAVQLIRNNVRDSQVLEDLLSQVSLDEKIDLIQIMLIIQSTADKSF